MTFASIPALFPFYFFIFEGKLSLDQIVGTGRWKSGTQVCSDPERSVLGLWSLGCGGPCCSWDKERYGRVG